MNNKDYNLKSVEDVIGFISMYAKKNDYGSFLTSFFLTWQLADPFNKKILVAAAVEIIKKYKLQDDAQKYKDGEK